MVREGFLSAPGVYVYPWGRELVTAETLARADDLKTLELAPLTIRHPAGLRVTPANREKVVVGFVGDRIEIVDDKVKGSIVAQRADAERSLASGKTSEASCGYRPKIRLGGGVHPEFGEYDAEQIARTYNHVALVERGRSPGGSAHIRTDEGDTMDREALIAYLTERGMTRADAASFADSADKGEAPTVAAFAAATARADEAKARADAADAELVTLRAERADDATLKAERLAWSKRRTELAPLVERFRVDAAELDNAEIEIAVLTAAGVEADKLGKPDYVAARIDAMLATRNDAAGVLKQFAAPPAHRNDAAALPVGAGLNFDALSTPSQR